MVQGKKGFGVVKQLRTLSPSDLQRTKDGSHDHPFLSCFASSCLSFCQLERFGLYELVNICIGEKPIVELLAVYFGLPGNRMVFTL